MLTMKRLSILYADVLLAGARAQVKEIDAPMCIAIADENANLIAFERMQGSKTPGINIAIDKSYIAAGICSEGFVGDLNWTDRGWCFTRPESGS